MDEVINAVASGSQQSSNNATTPDVTMDDSDNDNDDVFQLRSAISQLQSITNSQSIEIARLNKTLAYVLKYLELSTDALHVEVQTV